MLKQYLGDTKPLVNNSRAFYLDWSAASWWWLWVSLSEQSPWDLCLNCYGLTQITNAFKQFHGVNNSYFSTEIEWINKTIGYNFECFVYLLILFFFFSLLWRKLLFLFIHFLHPLFCIHDFPQAKLHPGRWNGSGEDHSVHSPAVRDVWCRGPGAVPHHCPSIHYHKLGERVFHLDRYECYCLPRQSGQ